MKKIVILREKFLKKLFWTRRTQTGGARINTSENTPKFFCWRTEKDEEYIVSRKKILLFRTFPEHFDWSFDYPNQNLLTRCQKPFLNVRNWTRKLYYQWIYFSTNCSFWLRRMQFSQLGRNISDRKWNLFAKCTNIKKINFVSKNIPIQNVPMVM